jgi:hypothetical protein
MLCTVGNRALSNGQGQRWAMKSLPLETVVTPELVLAGVAAREHSL